MEIFSQWWEEELAKDGFLGMGNWSPFCGNFPGPSLVLGCKKVI